MAVFIQQAVFNASGSAYPGKPTAVCSSRTMTPEGTVTFTQAGAVTIRMVWASYFAPVYSSECKYTVQVGTASPTQPVCKASAAARGHAVPPALPLLCAALLLGTVRARRA